jgi:hypothetical protein
VASGWIESVEVVLRYLTLVTDLPGPHVDRCDPRGVLCASTPDFHRPILPGRQHRTASGFRELPRLGWHGLQACSDPAPAFVPSTIRQALRWRPRTHRQVWYSTLVIGLALGLGSAAIRPTTIRNVVGLVCSMIWLGAIQSNRLSKRRDAAVVADCVATRPPSRLRSEQTRPG